MNGHLARLSASTFGHAAPFNARSPLTRAVHNLNSHKAGPFRVVPVHIEHLDMNHGSTGSTHTFQPAERVDLDPHRREGLDHRG